MIDYRENIFDGVPIVESNQRVYADIRSIAQIHYYADHNAIEMAISRTTFSEVTATSNTEKRAALLNYCGDLKRYFHDLIGDDYTFPGYNTKYFLEYLSNRGLEHLPDPNDRLLMVEALFYKCDIFCTRDYRAILKYRTLLKKAIPMKILTPFEWCNRYSYIKAYWEGLYNRGNW